MSQQRVVEPENIPVIAVQSMNDTHHEEAALVNALGTLVKEALQGAANEAQITQALEEWLAHTQAHFARENELMQAHGFPPYAVHAQEHAFALDGLRDVVRRWKETHDLQMLEQYVFETWPQWFHMHISSMDYVTAQFLSNYID